MKARVLPPEEWHRIQAIPPFDQGLALPDPDHWRILVVEDEAGEIVGTCSLFDTVHWDAWWIDGEHRGKAAVFRLLMDAGLRELREADIGSVHATIHNLRPDLQAIVERFGFISAPGKLYILLVDSHVNVAS
jgi:hypothetical protein